MPGRRSDATREAPSGESRELQPDAREGQAGPAGVADRLVVPSKPGNSGGGKGPEFKVNVRRGMRAGRLAMSLLPPPKVQKLQEALHAKAKGAPTYRFYALYDKVYRKDVLEWAYRARSRVEVRRGSLGRSLFSPVIPPFRLRVSHHLDHAPFPHPARRTVQADFPHTALGQGAPSRG